MASGSHTLLLWLFYPGIAIRLLFMAYWEYLYTFVGLIGLGKRIHTVETVETVEVQDLFAGGEDRLTLYHRKIFFSPKCSLKIETPALSPTNNDAPYGTFVEDILIFVCAVVACALIVVVGWWYFKCRSKAGHESEMEAGHERYMELALARDIELEEIESCAGGPRGFSYAELEAATENFSDDKKLGEGGFGAVYKGILPGNGKVVAVKRISQGSEQGRKEYLSEVKIGNLRHRNLVQLLGWCRERGDFLLVYEYLPNKRLDKYLFGEQNSALDWERRYKIARDVASALVYLHECWNQVVVHRDVKASNVMLDSDFNAKLGDFGLARMVERNLEAYPITVVAGTRGYLAPECFATGEAAPESDVFSFGAMSLEIASGKHPVEENFRLVEWVWDLYRQGKILDAVDGRLGGSFIKKEMERLLAVGLLCSHPDPKLRPTMREVAQLLKFKGTYIPPNLPDTNSHRPDSMSNSISRMSNSTSYKTAMTMNCFTMSGFWDRFFTSKFVPLLRNLQRR